jgi:chemotaxis protein MotB
MKKLNYLLSTFALMTLISCVPQRKYAELEALRNTTLEENKTLRAEADKLAALNSELQSERDTYKKEAEQLSADTARLGREYRQLRTQYDKIIELNDILAAQRTNLLAQTTDENKRLATDLQQLQTVLQKREELAMLLEKDLKEKEHTLAEKQKRLDELERLLSDQQMASTQLRKKLEQALLGFKDKGLTVSEKNGKVYVSMEAKLLFASGSTQVDAQGRKALADIGKAIEGEGTMEIMVEGHTDTDALNSTVYPRDNWDLSVLRATEVIKILLASSKVKPTVLTAAGRSEYYPVNTSDKSKNRRIEIIIQPKLDELYKIIQQP